MNKVILIDDDDGVLMLLSASLKQAGYDVICEQSPIKALELISSGNIPLVVSDIMMPEIDGLTLMTKIKEKTPQALVIFMTAHASIDSAIYALKEGAFAYLRKPFHPNELIQALQSASTKIRLMAENEQLVEDLKAAKTYNETIFKSLTYTVIATDVEGKIKKINHALEKLLGYAERELISKPIDMIFSVETARKGWQDMIRKQEIKNFSATLKCKDGSTIPKIINGTVMKDDSGKAIGFLGTLKDENQADVKS